MREHGCHPQCWGSCASTRRPGSSRAHPSGWRDVNSSKGQWNLRGFPWLPSGDAPHHLCPPASLYSTHVEPFHPPTHAATHTGAHSPHPHGPLPVVTLLWHRQTFPPLGFVALPCGIFQTVPSRDNPLFFSIFFPKDHGPSLSFHHQHISCKSHLHLLSLRLQQAEFFFFYLF